MTADDGGGGSGASGDATGTPLKDKQETSMKKPGFRYNNLKTTVQRQPKFEGKCDELKGHVYDCSDARQSDLFIKTTKEVAEFVACTYKYGGDIRLAVENLEAPIIAEPSL